MYCKQTTIIKRGIVETVQPSQQFIAPVEKSVHKKKFLLFSILFLLVALPFVLIFVQQQQEIRQRASVPAVDPNIVALVGPESVTKADIDAAIRKENPTDLTAALANSELRKKMLDQLLEEKLVRQQANKDAVTVTSGEISKEKDMFLEELPALSASDPAQLVTEEVSFQVLKEKVQDRVVTWRKIDKFVVNKSPGDPAFVSKFDNAQRSLEAIRTLLQQGNTATQAYASAKAEAGFDTNIQFIQDEIIEGESQMISLFKDPIFALHTNGVSSVLDSLGGTLLLVKITGENTTAYGSYASWLTAMKAQYVTIK